MLLAHYKSIFFWVASEVKAQKQTSQAFVCAEPRLHVLADEFSKAIHRGIALE